MLSMKRNKAELDKYITGLLAPLKEEKERQLRGFQIAQLYRDVSEQETAKRYLAGYLIHRNEFAPAHRLMGQILESQGDLEKAVASYKMSLDLDDKQKDILIKICEVYCQLDVDPDRARYWADRMEKVSSKHEVVFRLREHAIESMHGDVSGRNSCELEELLASHLAKNPKDPQLRIKLVRLYLDTERMNEAYTHVTEVEKKLPYPNSLEWYRCILDVLQEYKRESGSHINGLYHQTLLHTLNSLASLTVEQGRVADVMEVLYMFDQTLFSVARQDVQGDAWVVLIREMHAQFFYHAGCMLLKKAKQDRLSWKEASDLAGACYLCSLSYKPPNIHAAWFVKCPDAEKKLYEHWYSLACFRSSQAGHLARSLSCGTEYTWMLRTQDEYCTTQGKLQLYSVLFTLASMSDGRETSFLMKNTEFTTFSPELVRVEQLQAYELVSQLLRPDDLNYLVWNALQYYDLASHAQPDYKLDLFEDLQHGVLNLDTASPESLCLLDVQAFLYCVVREAALRHQETKRSVLSEPGEPDVLPVLLCDTMVTAQQHEWWTTAYRLFNNVAREELGKMRLTVQRGLEVIRLVGNHGMDVDLVVHLARTFEARLEESKVRANSVLDFANEIASLQARTHAYWKAAVDTVEKLLRGQTLKPPKVRLFKSVLNEPNEEELLGYLELGRYHLATVAVDEGRCEEAMEMFEKVSSPEAAFCQAQLYKGLASEETAEGLLDLTSDERKGTQVALLTKSREKLYLCLDRIRGDKFNKLNERLADDIDDIEARIARLESDQLPRDLQSSVSVDDVDATPDAAHKSFREPALRMSFIASTPRRHLDDSLAVNLSNTRLSASCMSSLSRTRPSPERLEAQIRHLSYNQDTVVKTLVEELKEQRRTIQQLQEKLESERIRWEEDRHKMMQNVYDAERSRDDEKRRADFDLKRVEEDRRRMDDDRRRIDEDRRRMDDEHRRRDSEASERVDHERHRIEQRYGDEREDLKRDFEQKRQAWQEEKAQWAREKQLLADERVQWAREKQTWQEEKVHFVRDRVEMEERFRRLQAAGLSQGLPGSTPARPAMPPVASTDMYGSPFRGYPQTGFDMMQNYAGYGFPQYGAMAGGLQGYTYQDYPTQQQETTGAHRIRGHRGVAQNANAYHDEDDEYYDSEDANDVAAEAEAPVPPSGNAACYMSPLQTGLGSVMQQIPGPGFFSSKSSATQSPAVQTPGIPVGQSPATQVAGKPITLGSMVLGSASTGTLAGLLSASTIASQAQGVSLYQGSIQQTVPTSVAVPNLTNTMSATQMGASSVMVSQSTVTTASSATSMTCAQISVPSPFKPSVASPGRRTSQEGDSDTEHHHDSYTEPHFEPLVTLPEVEVKTGEEDESVMYEARSRLFRFIDGQWKERGLGQIKILRNPSTEAVRVLMRRDKIHKVCANHSITPDMTIEFRADDKTRKHLTWRATDCTDEPRLEQFCCRFATPDIAEDFKKSFEDGVEISKSKNTDTAGAQSEVTSPADQAASVQKATVTTVVSSTFTSTQPTTTQAYVESLSQSASTSSVSSIQSGGFAFGTEGEKANSTTPKPGGGLFGLSDPTKAQTGSVFGVATSTATNPTGSVFGNVSSTSNDDKTSIFGGFTFSQKPEVKKVDQTENETEAKVGEKTKETKVEKEEKNVNPFTSFSFGVTAADSSTGPIFGGTKTALQVGFGDVAKEGAQTAFSQSGDFKGFRGTGAAVFGSAAVNTSTTGDDHAHKGEAETDYEPEVDFKPIVTLPEVEVKTGEEDEEKIFCHRAKMYRLDLETKGWKERGVGELKILQHKTTAKCRIVMRRDQVLKICANHMILAGMTIEPLLNSEKTYRWAAGDFSENELRHEMFAAKFKTQELADKFRDMFESCAERAEVSHAEQDKTVKEPQAAENADKPIEEPVKEQTKSLSELFKAKEGEWECKLCYVRNKKGSIQCVACESAKPGHEDEVEKLKNENASNASSTFSFGMASQGSTQSSGTPTPFSFGFNKTSASAAGTPSGGNVTFGGAPAFGTPSGGNIKFGGAAAFGTGPKLGTVTAPTFGTGGKNGLSFNNVSTEGATAASGDKTPGKGFSFNTQPDASGERKLSPEKPSFSFGTPTKESTEESTSTSFGTNKFTFSGLSPQKNEKPPKSPLKSPGDDGHYQEDDGEHIHFEPIVEMPTDYEHKTGTEDEEVLYAHRAKLFRFGDGQWKERGVGDVQILLHCVTKKVRLLMRREQVLKICVNHYVVPEMELNVMQGGNDKAFTWHADDFSDREVQHENFAIRFKTAEIATHFKQVFDLVKAGKDIPGDLQTIPDAVTQSPALAKKSPLKPPVELKEDPVPSLPLTPATFTFKPPEVTSATTPSFTGFQFSAPSFGSGVFSPNMFGSATQTTSSFTFGQTTSSSTTSSQSQPQDTPKTGRKLLGTGTNLFETSGVTPGTSTTMASVSSSPSADNSAAMGDESILRSLLIDPGTGTLPALRSALDVTQDDDDNDVIFVDERTPSKEHETRAKKYMLPKYFFMYEDSDAPLCRGCIGCHPDNFDFNWIGQGSIVADKEELNLIVPQQSTVTGDRGNVHYAAQLDSVVKEELVHSSVTSVTGDRGNVHYSKELDQAVSETVIQTAVSYTTGDRGNVHYSKELDQSEPVSLIQSSTASSTGDRGNVHYSKELDQTQPEARIQPSVTYTTGDKGNIHYSKELDQPQLDCSTGDTASLFGVLSESNQEVFGSGSTLTDGGSLFGGVSSTSAGLGFADVAKQSQQSGGQFAFGKTADGTAFQWQGAGRSLFRSSPSTGGAADEDGDTEEGQDVHFEPIVTLPEVEVFTGEEDETVLFCHRAKLYRFVTEPEQAWKERGVGDAKILQHNETGKFRVLMRRDKILKIACNHFITIDMKLKPLQTSEVAWCWNAMDFAENEARNEQFCIKFKKQEQATDFKDVFQRCQEELQNIPAPVIQQDAYTVASQPITEPDTAVEEVYDSNGYAHGDAAAAYQDDEAEDEEDQVVFSKRVTMFYIGDGGVPEQSCTGELRVIYDDDVIGYRIVMTGDDGRQFCSHIICRKYTLQKSSKKRFAEWTAKDFVTDEPLRRTFRVQFSSVPGLDEFLKAFRQGIDLAKESELDEVPDSVSVTGEILVPEVGGAPEGGED